VLHQRRFWDLPPAQVWARLLDEGTYLASISTMYRLLRAHGESRDRRGCPEFRGTLVAAPMIIRPLPPPCDPCMDR
jgi:hypothetical protein